MTKKLCEKLDKIQNIKIFSPFYDSNSNQNPQEDGIGRYHDRILFLDVDSGVTKEQLQDIISAVKKEMAEKLGEFNTEEIEGFINNYLRIDFVIFDEKTMKEIIGKMMIAQLSHDIKTPITSIQATVEGILDGVIEEEEQIHYLTTISRQTERLNKLVEELDVLTLNAQPRIESDGESEIVFIDQLLIEAMSEFQLLIEQEERDIYIQVSPESAKIKSHYDKLSRILVNLLNNAFKYSDPGTKIEVVAQLTEQILTISVKDEGQGIAPEDLDKIFKRLYRVETSRNMKTGGHGLGLAIARELAHQLGGEITVESQCGLGSIFTFALNLT